MNPRESSLLHASAILLARHGTDAAYGPAHAVRDALDLEKEVSQQTDAAIAKTPPGLEAVYRELEHGPDPLRKAGAL